MAEQDILDSDEAFRRQFDPADPVHHKGDQRPVPLGGSRIPEGLTEYPLDENCEESAGATSPEWESVRQLREAVSALKNAVTATHSAVGVTFTAQQQRGKVDGALAEVRQKLDNYLALLSTIGSDLEALYSLSSPEPTAVVNELLKEAQDLPADKEAYGEFILAGHGRTRRLFAEMTRLLKIMKEIKNR